MAELPARVSIRSSVCMAPPSTVRALGAVLLLLPGGTRATVHAQGTKGTHTFVPITLQGLMSSSPHDSYAGNWLPVHESDDISYCSYASSPKTLNPMLSTDLSKLGQHSPLYVRTSASYTEESSLHDGLFGGQGSAPGTPHSSNGMDMARNSMAASPRPHDFTQEQLARANAMSPLLQVRHCPTCGMPLCVRPDLWIALRFLTVQT
jgi:hypothetical protein